CEVLEGPGELTALERALIQAQQGQLTALNETQLQLYVAHGHPDALQILEALSVGCLVSYRFGNAHGYLSEWIDRDPNNSQAFIWRSLADEHMLDLVAARDDARQAVALAPTHFEARLRLGQALLLTTEYREAAQVFEGLYQKWPADPVVAMGM